MALLLAVAAAVGAAATASAATGGYGPYPPSPPSPPPAAPPVPASYTLSVATAGSGSGSVTSAPAGIACGSDCDEIYASSTSVTLSAAPDTGSSFAGWSGACTGSGSCTLSMDAPKSVTATFTAAQAALEDTVLQGSVGKVELVVRSGRRIARSSLALSEAVRAELRVVRRGRVLASKRANLAAGRRLVALRIPDGVAGGRATLRIALEDAAGNSRTIARRLRIPSA